MVPTLAAGSGAAFFFGHTNPGYWVILLILLGLYRLECQTCQTYRYLKSMTDDPSCIATYITELLKATPVVNVDIVCSHKESHTDSEGNTHMRTVVTHRSNHEFSYGTFHDKSDLHGMSSEEIADTTSAWGRDFSFPLLAVDSIVNITCGEQSTEQALEAFRLDQYEAHKHLDNHCKATVNKSLPGFKELQLLKLDDAGCLLTITGFWLCSAFFMTVPYRIYFEQKTGAVKLHFNKIIHAMEEHPRGEHVPVVPTVVALGAFNNNASAPYGTRIVAQMPATSAMQVTPGQQQPQVVSTTVVAAPPSSNSAEERLSNLQALKDQGVITEEEYNRKRADIIADV
jgi:hypothetical protein